MEKFKKASFSQKAKDTIIDYSNRLGVGIGIKGPFNIQFIVDKDENVFIIEVNPRSSRTVPFLSKATGYSLADIATEVIMGKSLKEQGIFDIYPDEKKRWYVKVPVFSFNKIRGLDAYLSPEMKSTGEAIGYDDKLNRALYKALQASGMHLQNYGTVFATIADKLSLSPISISSTDTVSFSFTIGMIPISSKVLNVSLVCCLRFSISISERVRSICATVLWYSENILS